MVLFIGKRWLTGKTSRPTGIMHTVMGMLLASETAPNFTEEPPSRSGLKQRLEGRIVPTVLVTIQTTNVKHIRNE